MDHPKTKRLQVDMPLDLYAKLEELARFDATTLSGWVKTTVVTSHRNMANRPLSIEQRILERERVRATLKAQQAAERKERTPVGKSPWNFGNYELRWNSDPDVRRWSVHLPKTGVWICRAPGVSFEMSPREAAANLKEALETMNTERWPLS